MHFLQFVFFTDTLPAESCGTYFSSYIFFVFIVTQTHYLLSGDWELRHYYLDDCWHVRSEEAERRCVAYDDRPEVWCKSFSEGEKKKKRRQRDPIPGLLSAHWPVTQMDACVCGGERHPSPFPNGYQQSAARPVSCWRSVCSKLVDR
jgi:hypothetical protein